MAELFDDITRIVGGRIPRRRALKLIMGLFAGGALGLLADSSVAAQAGVGQCYTRASCLGPMTGGNGFTYQVCCTDLVGVAWCPQARLVPPFNLCQQGACVPCGGSPGGGPRNPSP